MSKAEQVTMDIKPPSPQTPVQSDDLPVSAASVNLEAEKPNKKPPQRLWLKIMIALVGLLVLAVAGAIGWYQYQMMPVSGQEIAVEFKIQPGEGAVAIGDRLEAGQLVRSSTVFQLHLRQRGDSSKLRAGTYLLSPSLSTKAVADVLVEGKVAQKLVTITPGLRLDEIEDQLVAQGFDQAAVKKAVSGGANPINPGASLEGYILPESYSLDLGASPADVVKRAVKQFEQELSNEIKVGLDKQGLSLREGIILASIVQGETDASDQQPKVARVFLNRLKADMMLGADPTFRYAAYLEGVPESPSVNSPYNTRINRGLPPGPISNFKMNALLAVAQPASNNYLYFVTGDDGTFHYSKTLEEHENKVDKYCIELCKI